MASKTAVRPGWYGDPTRRHKLRYRDDEQWTMWVADHDYNLSSDVMSRDLDGLTRMDLIMRRRHWRNGIIITVVLGAFSLIVWGCFDLYEQQNASTRAGQSEMNSWRLPPTVRRDGAEEVVSGDFQSMPTITRYYKPVGVSLGQAELDLVNALHEQGYTFDGSGGYWTSDNCGKLRSKSCYVMIDVAPGGKRIEVDMAPDG